MQNREDIEKLQKKLSTFPIFEGTQGFQLEQIIRASHIIPYKAGGAIYEANDVSTAFFIILSGVVKIEIHELKSIELGSGNYFGEYSLIENRPHNGTAIAKTDCEILVLPSDVFNNLLQQSLPFSNNLLRILVKRLKATERLESALIEKNIQINEQNVRINDSNELAGIIQKALLPQEKLLKLKFDSCFLLFQPCENISGDFYWFAQRHNEYCVVVADCTGHGAPAGLISIMGITYLNEIVSSMQDPDPGRFLTLLSKKIKQAFTSTDDRFQGQLGMDISMITINFETMTLRYSGANLPVFVVNKQKILELEPEKCSLNGSTDCKTFRSQSLKIEQSDTIYMFTDGYTDQLGGKDEKRFGYARFKEIILNVAELNVHKQQIAFIEQFNKWKGDRPQIDDATLLGIQI